MTTYHLIITGKVQGVYYRASAKEIALRLGIAGWVKNTPEGNVEAMACGEEHDLELFTEWCKKGPDNADVDEVIVTEMPGIGFEIFEIR